MQQQLQQGTLLQGGKYRIERVLGQGGFGITYMAVQLSLNRYVAIKELFIGGSGQAINDRRGNLVMVTNAANQASFNQQKEKFKKEALRLANLNHPNLPKVHDFFEENGTAYYVMDYIEGSSLRTKLNREGVLSESLVLKYLQQLLPALEAAHKQSIWHLDIKPENIMVDRYGHVYLIDFGASKHVEPNSTLTTSLALAYTPGFCPPELIDLSNETPEYYIQAIKDIGPWTDIYALGATMYNLLTDSIPPSKRRLEKEGRNAFMFPYKVSSSTQDLIVWMMKPNSKDRPRNVSDISTSVFIVQDDDEGTKIQFNRQCNICGYVFSPTDNRTYCPICHSVMTKDNDRNTPNMDAPHYQETFIPQHVSVNGHVAVDLGLSVLWATMDVGALNEDSYGECYLWGDPDGEKTRKVLNSFLARWFKGGPSKNKICGDYQYDTATNQWGTAWRMPTCKEFEELATQCTWELVDNNHARFTGPNGNSIVLDNRYHWIGESIFMFSWNHYNGGIRWGLLSIQNMGKDYTDLIFPVRAVANK